MKNASDSGLCIHCGTPVPPDASDARYCCTGCAYVHDLLCSEGLERFYDLRGSQSLTPVSPQALRTRDYTWLEEMSRMAEENAAEGGAARLRLGLQGISCMGCVWLIERVFRQLPGAVRLEISSARGELNLEWQPHEFDIVGFARAIQKFGYLVGKPGIASERREDSSLNRRVGLCGAFAMNSMAFCLPSYLGMGADFMFASWFDLVAACSATLSLLVGGTYFAERSVRALQHGVLHIDTPITLGIVAAWLGSMVGWMGQVPGLKYFDFVSIFIFLMLAGRWLQQSAVERNRRRLLQLQPVPEEVECVAADDSTSKMPLGEVQIGSRLRILPGEVCPVNSSLCSQTASLSLEWINGESAASPRVAGQAIPSGALNIGRSPILVEAREAWAQSLLQRLGASREAGQGAALPFARLLRVYLMVVVVLGILGAFVWWWSGHGAAQALQVMISVFVVSCPCALGVAAPFADDLAAGWMERLGVFVRANGLWQRLAKVRKVVFDKTGTLTAENPMLRDSEVLEHLQPQERAALRHLVADSLHPVSRSLFDALGPWAGVGEAHSEPVQEEIGQGLHFRDGGGHLWSLGRPGWRGGAAHRLQAGVGDAELCREGKLVTAFRFTEALRPATRAALQELRERGLALALLSGDQKDKVRQTAQSIGLQSGEWEAEMTPDQKAARVRELNQEDTLYIGDGANDSLALEASLCGGSPVTGRNFLEHKADFYFLGNSLCFLPRLLELAILRQRAVKRVFLFALAYNMGAVALSLAGHMSPLLAAILMPLSSLMTLGLARTTFGAFQKASKPLEAQNTVVLTQGMHGRPAAAHVG